MNNEVPFLMYIFLAWAVLEIVTVFIGGIRTFLFIRNHPYSKKPTLTQAEVEELRPLCLDAIERFHPSPFQKHFLKRNMNEAIDKIIKEMKEKNLP